MRFMMAACAVALLIGATVPAAADTWTGAYGNTIESTYADGRVVKVYVNADHSYSIALPNGVMINGTWADGAGGSCFTPTNAAPGSKPVCFPIKEYKVGDTFAGEDATGKFTGVIKAGR